MKEKLLKYINVKGLLLEWLLADVIKSKLQALVDDTSTPWDNTLLDVLYPQIEEAAKKAVDDLVEHIPG